MHATPHYMVWHVTPHHLVLTVVQCSTAGVVLVLPKGDAILVSLSQSLGVIPILTLSRHSTSVTSHSMACDTMHHSMVWYVTPHHMVQTVVLCVTLSNSAGPSLHAYTHARGAPGSDGDAMCG